MSESVWQVESPRPSAAGMVTADESVEALPDGEEYWDAARRPWASFVFLLPLVFVYEIGVWLCSRGSVPARNGVDSWLRTRLSEAGAGHAWAPPLIVLGALLAWQWAGKHEWRLRPATLAGMFAESLVFAFVLIVIGTMQSGLLASLDVTAPLALGEAATRSVVYVGAGIYEELVFRLLLLPACFLAFRRGGASPRWSIALAVFATSTAFSIAHYVGGAEQFAMTTFTFRTLAGAYFATLFVTRGFGVAVGCHAMYDVVVGVLLAQ